jgi:hypothetical protein
MALEYISENVLPEALDTLSSRHDSMIQLAQYVEDKYAAQKHRGDDLSVVEGEGLTALAEALVEIANDVSVISDKLESMLEVESTSIGVLTERVGVATARMRLSEEQYARRKLQKVRQNKTVNLSHNEACKQLVGMGELRSSTFERYSMKKRLNVKNDMIFDALR